MAITANSRAAGRGALQGVLNKFGAQGWELTSKHEVRVRRSPVSEEKGASFQWHAELRPVVALFRRSIQCGGE